MCRSEDLSKGITPRLHMVKTALAKNPTPTTVVLWQLVALIFCWFVESDADASLGLRTIDTSICSGPEVPVGYRLPLPVRYYCVSLHQRFVSGIGPAYRFVSRLLRPRRYWSSRPRLSSR
jgi:hypothetical protein